MNLINIQLQVIGRNAFYSSNLTSIVLPSTVTTIHKEAFMMCPKLEAVTLSASLSYLGEYVFSNDPLLHTVTFVGNTPCEADDFTFNNCVNLMNINFANGIMNISKGMFRYCHLECLTIPKSIKQIDSFAFQYSGIKSLTIDYEAQLDVLSSNCFDACEDLEFIDLPPSIKEIGANCFEGTKIKNFTVPNNVKFLSPFCFKDCTALETFHINGEAVLERIRYGVFKGCTNFAKITCNSTKFSLNNGALYDKDETVLIVVPPKLKIKYFAFPDTLKTIGENALYGCIFIRQILIPSESVEVIENNAFEDCSNLKSINIPLCTSNIGEKAFKGCKLLQCELEIENETKTFRDDLVKKALLPEKCLKNCGVYCTVHAIKRSEPPLFMISAFIMLLD